MHSKKIFNMKLFAVTAIVVIGLLFVANPVSRSLFSDIQEVWAAETKTNVPQKDTAATSPKKVPRLIDVGADKCIPCIAMAPILEEMKKEYAGILDVEFVDVWKNPNAGQKYGIRGIPTQIFYDASGKELGRHMGFISKEQILQSFKKLGVELRNPEQKKTK
ncbi:MAG: thioredoxin family protein [Proteobacteria bacterium]|nr:thioredoxin family protein [Pseudomonadota bacterium]